MADDDTYVHRPGESRTASAADTDATDADGGLTGRQSWVLVAVLLTCFVGFPAAILVWPPTFLPFRDAYLALAMVPAVALGAVGVWLAGRD